MALMPFYEPPAERKPVPAKLTDGQRSDVAHDVLLGPGFRVLEGFFDPGPALEAVRPAVEAHRAAGGGAFSGGYRPDILFSLGLEEMMADEDLLAVGRLVLRDEPAFGSFGCNVVPPGSDGMAAHLDYPYFAMSKLPSRATPALCMQLIWYLTDVGEDDAPTFVVPETQRRPRFPRQSGRRQKVLAKAGSVCVSHGALWHGVSPHRGSDDRPVLLGSYVPFWVQPMLTSRWGLGLSEGLRRLLRADMGDRIGRAYSRTT